MLHQIKIAASRSQETLLGDAIGAAALVTILLAGLCLPGLN